jgi:hypothetical protein
MGLSACGSGMCGLGRFVIVAVVGAPSGRWRMSVSDELLSGAMEAQRMRGRQLARRGGRRVKRAAEAVRSGPGGWSEVLLRILRPEGLRSGLDDQRERAAALERLGNMDAAAEDPAVARITWYEAGPTLERMRLTGAQNGHGHAPIGAAWRIHQSHPSAEPHR